MEKEELAIAGEVFCDHQKHKSYIQNNFDILEGFELILTRCLNCHKILVLEIKKFG